MEFQAVRSVTRVKERIGVAGLLLLDFMMLVWFGVDWSCTRLAVVAEEVADTSKSGYM